MTKPLLTDGLWEVAPIPAQATARFISGSPVHLRSVTGGARYTCPADVASQPLTLTHALQGSQRNPTPRGIAGRKQGLPTFYLNAQNDLGQEVHQFNRPLTVTVGYTPQQLRALGISEGDLTLFWYDDSNQGLAPRSEPSRGADQDSVAASTPTQHAASSPLGPRGAVCSGWLR